MPDAWSPEAADVRPSAGRAGGVRPAAPAHAAVPRGRPVERALYEWVRHVIDGTYAGVSHETLVRVLALKDADGRQDSGVDDARLEQLEQFVARTGRFPSKHGPAARLTGEITLSIWASQVRNGRRDVPNRVAAEVARLAADASARRPGRQPRRES